MYAISELWETKYKLQAILHETIFQKMEGIFIYFLQYCSLLEQYQ